MGSPLGPLFANIFMSEFEHSHLDKLKELGLVTWFRYVDDVFASLTSRDSVNTILNYLNNQHPNIRFTVEHEKDQRLPFLDTTTYRGLTRFHTTIYRKKDVHRRLPQLDQPHVEEI